MAISRVLYAAQTVLIKTGGVDYLLPVQSASADETIPVDDVLVLGKLGAAGRLQKDVASCKASVKGYICSSVDGNAAVAATEVTDLVMNTFLESLRSDSIAGTAITVDLKSNTGSALGTAGGFQFKGAVSNIGIDISKGNFGMLDLSFDGVGQINSMSMDGAGVNQAADNAYDEYVNSAIPVTSENVGLPNDADQDDTIASLKFAFDMPTESLSRLGGKIAGTTSVVESDNKTYSKPPFKSSFTVDGQSLTKSDAAANASSASNDMDAFDIGDLEVQLVGSAISARSINQAVGDVGATFSITVEGTDARFGAAHQVSADHTPGVKPGAGN